MDAYLGEVQGDPRAVPELPDLRFRTETLDVAEAVQRQLLLCTDDN